MSLRVCVLTYLTSFGNARTDIIISNKDEILDRIAKSISYTRLISESFGENIE